MAAVALTGKGTAAASGSATVWRGTTTTSTASFPALVVEWLPGEGPFTTDGNWVDITEYVVGGSTFIGRQYELDRFQAGSCSLTLAADTRLFDPDWSSGPFYGQLIPMAQLRVWALWSGVIYPVWRGYVTDWGQTVPGADNLVYTTVQASDAFMLLEQIRLPSSAWALEVQRVSPSLWFRLGETDTVRVSDSSDNGNYGLYDNCTQGASGLIPNDNDGAVSFTNTSQDRVWIQNPSLIAGYPFTFSCMYQIDPGVGTTSAPYIFTTGGSYGVWITTDSPSGAVLFTISDGTNLRQVYTTSSFSDGKPHHLVCVAASSTSMLIYVDGTLQTVGTGTSGSGAPAFVASPDGYYLGNLGNSTPVSNFIYGFGGADPGTIDEAVIWDGTALTAAQIATLALAAKSGWDGDDSGARVTRFLDAIDWPSDLRDILPGISTLGPASWSAGTSALSALQAWADTEYGLFYIDQEGRIVWRSRHARYLDTTSLTSQATFSDDAADNICYSVENFELARDETLIRNPVTASRSGGISVTVKNQTLIDTKYGPRTWASPNTEDQKDSAVRDRAVWLLARYQEQTTRLRSMTIHPPANPTYLWPQALGRQIGDKITVKRTPLNLGNTITSTQWIEGIRHKFSPTFWATTFSGSPTEDSAYLVLDDVTLGLLDTGQLVY